MELDGLPKKETHLMLTGTLMVSGIMRTLFK